MKSWVRERSACHPEIHEPRYMFSAEEIHNSFTGLVILIGHSQAGPCVWEIADTCPDKVKAMIAVEPSGPPFINIQTGKPETDAEGNPKNWGIAHLPMTFDPSVDTNADLKIRSFERSECWKGMEFRRITGIFRILESMGMAI